MCLGCPYPGSLAGVSRTALAWVVTSLHMLVLICSNTFSIINIKGRDGGGVCYRDGCRHVGCGGAGTAGCLGLDFPPNFTNTHIIQGVVVARCKTMAGTAAVFIRK